MYTSSCSSKSNRNCKGNRTFTAGFHISNEHFRITSDLTGGMGLAGLLVNDTLSGGGTVITNHIYTLSEYTRLSQLTLHSYTPNIAGHHNSRCQ